MSFLSSDMILAGLSFGDDSLTSIFEQDVNDFKFGYFSFNILTSI